MHDTRHTGVRLVLTNPSDPGRLDDFSDWYDTYTAALTVPGYLADAFRFENPDGGAGQNSPRYATIYDIVTSDPATAWPDTEHSPDYPTPLFSDPRAKLVAPALRASYALVGSQARTDEHGPLTGVHIILSNGGDDTGRSNGKPRFFRPACSTPRHDFGSSKDPPSRPNGSRYSRPMPATPSTRTRERPAPCHQLQNSNRN